MIILLFGCPHIGRKPGMTPGKCAYSASTFGRDVYVI